MAFMLIYRLFKVFFADWREEAKHDATVILHIRTGRKRKDTEGAFRPSVRAAIYFQREFS